MCKSLFLKPGYLARCGALWYEPGILIVVEQHERLDVYTARKDNMPGIRRGSHTYAQLDLGRLPAGLCAVDRSAEAPMLQQVA